MSEEQPQVSSNPIGEMFAAEVTAYLHEHEGCLINPQLIERLGKILVATECEVVGINEIASLLGVSKQRVFQLARDDDNMPNPISRLAATQVWLKTDIEMYAVMRVTRAGRRKKS